MKVYVISLARAADRRKFMKKQLDKLGLNYEIVDAIDFMDLTQQDFDLMTDKAAVAAIPYLTPGAQACALSHVKVFNKMVMENEPLALVLEDDAILPYNLSVVLSDIEQNIKEDEVISLSYYHRYEADTFVSTHSKEKLAHGGELVYPVSLHKMGSTMAYVISKSVAAKLAEVMMPISVVADWWGVYYDKGAFSSFRCLYPNQLKPAFFTTTLDYGTEGIKSKFAALIRKYKLPFLYDILLRKDNKYLEGKYRIHLVDRLPFHKNPDTLTYSDMYYARS